jgi:hypothetical protein
MFDATHEALDLKPSTTRKEESACAANGRVADLDHLRRVEGCEKSDLDCVVDVNVIGEAASEQDQVDGLRSNIEGPKQDRLTTSIRSFGLRETAGVFP